MALSHSAVSELFEAFGPAEGTVFIGECVGVAMRELVESGVTATVDAGRHELTDRAGWRARALAHVIHRWHDGAQRTTEVRMGPPIPAEEAGTSQRTQTDTDVEGERSSPNRAPEPELKDDGSVPDKQISRWKNEGGSFSPTD